MVQYATDAELATHMGHTVDTDRANQLLEIASARFSVAADTWFEPVDVTWTVAGNGSRTLRLPNKPIQDVDSVTIAGTTVTDFTIINSTLYRETGFGTCTFPPQPVVVSYTHGYSVAPDDVKGAVCDMAEAAYEVMSGLLAEQIDDYHRRFAAGVGEVVTLTAGAQELADYYRGVFAA